MAAQPYATWTVEQDRIEGTFEYRGERPRELARSAERVWEYAMTDGQLVALDSRTGKDLFSMGEGVTASPMTYAVDGKQYVAIASATAIFSFGLFEPIAFHACAEALITR